MAGLELGHQLSFIIIQGRIRQKSNGGQTASINSTICIHEQKKCIGDSRILARILPQLHFVLATPLSDINWLCLAQFSVKPLLVSAA